MNIEGLFESVLFLPTICVDEIDGAKRSPWNCRLKPMPTIGEDLDLDLRGLSKHFDRRPRQEVFQEEVAIPAAANPVYSSIVAIEKTSQVCKRRSSRIDVEQSKDSSPSVVQRKDSLVNLQDVCDTLGSTTPGPSGIAATKRRSSRVTSELSKDSSPSIVHRKDSLVSVQDVCLTLAVARCPPAEQPQHSAILGLSLGNKTMARRKRREGIYVPVKPSPIGDKTNLFGDFAVTKQRSSRIAIARSKDSSPSIAHRKDSLVNLQDVCPALVRHHSTQTDLEELEVACFALAKQGRHSDILGLSLGNKITTRRNRREGIYVPVKPSSISDKTNLFGNFTKDTLALLEAGEMKQAWPNHAA